ncbi:MAG: O-antigen ligase family protein [Candidatus Omnitrophota bacterium]|jgi:O-antigen ligase
MLKIFELIAYWSIVLVPFSVAISTGFSNTALGFLAFGYFGKKIMLRQPVFMKTPLTVPFLLFLAIAVLSILNSNVLLYPANRQGILKLLKYGLIFLICAEEIRTVEHIKKIVMGLVFTCLFVSVDAFWQLRLGWDFVHLEALQSCLINLSRPTGPFPNPNVMGIFLGLIAPLILGLGLAYYSGKEKISWLIVFLFTAMGIYLTLSRGSGLGLFASALLLAVILRKKALAVFLIGILLIYPLVMPKNIKTWAQKRKYNPLVFLFNEDRLSMYMNSMNMIQQHPFIGVGVNTFSQNYGKYKTKKAEEYCVTPASSYAQSNFFQMAGEVGLIGLGIFFCFLGILCRELIRVYKRSTDTYVKVLAVSLVACFTAFLINGVTESSLYYSRVAIMFWYFVGISLSLRKFIKP